MATLFDNEGLPREVHVQQVWIEITKPNRNTMDRYVVAKPIANYIDSLEKELKILKHKQNEN